MKCLEFLAQSRSGMRMVGRSRFWAGVILVFAGMLFASHPAAAQNTGTIFGTVVDSTGAIVQHAKIAIFDADRGTTRTVTSNNVGEFTVDNLPVGTYQMTVSSPTFESYVLDGLKLDAEQQIKETVKLKPGPANETTVVADSGGVGLDTHSATLGNVIDNNLIENLPIDGENIVSLAALLPGVVDVNAPMTFTSDTGGPTFSASGGRNNQALLLFDGLMFNNLFYNTGINYPPHPALQEVSVILNNYKAEYGRSAGSIFNVLTRSGTNQIHGEIWDYIQNQMFNASNYAENGIRVEDNFHQFGATMGGPIVKDKVFFFGALQQLIGRLQETSGFLSTPTLSDRGLQADAVTALPCRSDGAFPGFTCANYTDQLFVAPTAAATGSYSKLLNPLDAGGSSGMQASPQDTINMQTSAWQQAGGQGVPPCLGLLSQANVFASTHGYYQNDPYGTTKVNSTSLTEMPYGEIPTACLNPVMMAIINKYVPTPGLLSDTGLIQAVVVGPDPQFDTNGLARLDYHFGRHSIDARYNYIRSTAFGSLGGDIPTFNPAHQYAYTNFGNLGDTWVMTPNIVNVLRVGYKRFENGHLPSDNHTLNDFGGIFVVPGIPTLPQIHGGGETLGTATQGYLDTINENFELEDKMTWSHGKHNVAAGFSFLRLQYLNRSDYSGSLSFGSTFTRLGMADNETGLVSSVQAQSRLVQGGIQHDVFAFVQDDWRLTSTLTLNLGVRYELPFQWFEPHGEAATFTPGYQSTVFPNAPGGLTFPGDQGILPSLVPTDYNGVAPRFGFAYDLFGRGKLVIRGGYGIFFDAVNANVVGVGEPYHYLLNESLPPGGASVPLQGFAPIPAGYNPKNPIFQAPYSIFFPDKNFRTPYIEAVNFGFQYKMPAGATLEANYVGRFARKLTIPLDLNPDIYDCSGGYFQSNPTLYCNNANSTSQSQAARVRYADFNYGGQGIVDILSVGTSNYNALQVTYRQRTTKRLSIMSSYTLSRSIDLQTNGQTTSNTAPDVFNIKSERGLSDTFAKHNFTMGWVVRLPNMTSGPGFVRNIFSNWVYSGKYLARTGHPFSVTINDDQALNAEPNQRAALVPGINPLLPSGRHRIDKINEWFNVLAFTYPTQGIFSPQQRNSFIGPGYITTDMNLGRDFPMQSLREGMRLNVRVDFFDVFNTPNLAQPNSTFSCQSTNLNGASCVSIPSNTNIGFSKTSTFGEITKTLGSASNSSATGRKAQIALTLYY